MASHFVGWVKSFIEEELGVALAPTSALNEVTLGEASEKWTAINMHLLAF